MFNENFIHKARERVRTALITAPVDQLSVCQLQDSLITCYGKLLNRGRRDLNELVRLTVQGQPLFRLLELSRKSIMKPSKSRNPLKPAGGVSTLTRVTKLPSLDNRIKILGEEKSLSQISGHQEHETIEGEERTPSVSWGKYEKDAWQVGRAEAHQMEQNRSMSNLMPSSWQMDSRLSQQEALPALRQPPGGLTQMLGTKCS